MKEQTPFAEEFKERIYHLVRMIPLGKVATYGQLAFLAGLPRHARMVGRVLKETPRSLRLPCHRVVNCAGRTVPGWPEQRRLLEREGVRFRPNGRVDLDAHLWEALPAAFSGE